MRLGFWPRVNTDNTDRKKSKTLIRVIRVHPWPILFLAALLLSWANIARAAAAAPPVVTRLASGATLIVSPEPDSPLVALDIFLRVGQAEERQARLNGAPAPAGITSLIARAWLSGSEGRGAESLARDIGGLGGNVGTDFGGDYVELYAVTTAGPDTFNKAAATLIANVIGRPAFDEDALVAARQDQLRALQLENDALFAHTLSRVRSRVWDVSPYAGSPLGTEQSVRGITVAQVRAFYHAYFRPDRAVIVVAGNVEPDAVRREIEANIGAAGWAQRGVSPPTAPLAPETLAKTPPDVSVGRRSRATVLMAGFLAPSTSRPDDYAALLVLDALVGGGKGGRLFRNVRDTRGIGYDVGSLVQPGRYQSLLAGYLATITLLRGPNGQVRSTLGEASRALVDEMRSLAQSERPLTEAEIARAKAYVKGRYALRHERLKDRAYLLGWSEVMGLGAAFDTSFDARIDAVTPEQVRGLARTVLGANHVLAATVPES